MPQPTVAGRRRLMDTLVAMRAPDRPPVERRADRCGADLRARFRARFRTEPILVRAPGRVNLVGEHTDYNDGLVLPMAIDRATWVAGARRDERALVVASDAEVVAGDVRLPLDGDHAARGDWTDWIVATVRALTARGVDVPGATLLVGGDLPLGAGLSSSAALTVGVATACLHLAGATLDHAALARACQDAEARAVGTRCGIMDPFVVAAAAAGHALLLDCRSLAARQVPLPAAVRVVVANSMVRHALAEGAYNERRAECEAAVRLLAAVDPRVRSLRDVDAALLDVAVLPPLLARRARHVVTENARVEATVAALAAGDLAALGTIFAASHASLRDDYAVSAPELDLLVDLAAREEGAVASRMTGGGFGGSTVHLVRADAAQAFADRLGARYRATTGRQPDVFPCDAAGGAAVVADA